MLLGVVITWQRTVEHLVLVSTCVIDILPLRLGSKYKIMCCDKQHFYVLIVLLVAPLNTPMLEGILECTK